MKQEDLQKTLEALGKGGINVAGDFVMNKNVEYEVNNVEAGGTGIQIVYGKEYPGQGHHQATDEQVSRAITVINGKEKALRHQHAFLGICCYLASFHKWPQNKSDSVKRINDLPDADKWEIPCKWESVRKVAVYNFAMIDYSEWGGYSPKDIERKIFHECRDVARAFEQQLLIEMQP